jgi:hypothetical protein
MAIIAFVVLNLMLHKARSASLRDRSSQATALLRLKFHAVSASIKRHSEMGVVLNIPYLHSRSQSYRIQN